MMEEAGIVPCADPENEAFYDRLIDRLKTEGASGAPRGQRRSTGPPGLSVTQSPLEKLGGHESTLLAHVADFVGVPRGRTLRNMREAHEAFAEMLGDILPLQPRARGSSSSSSSGSLSD